MSADSNKIDHNAGKVMEKTLQDEDFILYACLINNDGKRIAEHVSEKNEENMASLRSSVHELTSEYPRKGLSRAFIEDERGTIAVYRVLNDMFLLTVAEQGSPLGAVSMNAGKLAEEIEGR